MDITEIVSKFQEHRNAEEAAMEGVRPVADMFFRLVLEVHRELAGALKAAGSPTLPTLTESCDNDEHRMILLEFGRMRVRLAWSKATAYPGPGQEIIIPLASPGSVEMTRMRFDLVQEDPVYGNVKLTPIGCLFIDGVGRWWGQAIYQFPPGGPDSHEEMRNLVLRIFEFLVVPERARSVWPPIEVVEVDQEVWLQEERGSARSNQATLGFDPPSSEG